MRFFEDEISFAGRISYKIEFKLDGLRLYLCVFGLRQMKRVVWYEI